MKQQKSKAPEFQSLEEEKSYWEAHGPLADGQRGRVNKPIAGQKRSSVLAVRLTGDELTKLRDVAAERGVGPSTFARIVLTSAIENANTLPKHITKNPAYKPNYKMKIEIITEKSHIKMRDLEPGDWFTTDGVTGPPLMKLNPVNLGIFSCVGLTGNLYNVGGERVVCPLESTVPHCMQHRNAVEK